MAPPPPPPKRELHPDSDPCIYACDPTHNPYRFCPLFCIPDCPDFCDSFPEPPPPTPLPPIHHHNNLLSPSFIAMFALLSSAFVIAVSYLIYSLISSRTRSRTRRQLSNRVSEYESSTDVLNFHPAWYIATVGLQRSAVESIPVFEYNTNDNLVHDTSCSVCLTEFRDGDALRLLPKCFHAFHVPCIDTWLSSRTTCPVCRAPVVPTSSGFRPENEASVIEVVDGPSSSAEVGSEDSAEFDVDDTVEEIDERRLIRRAMSLNSLCVESYEKMNSSLVERSNSCTGKVFSSSRNVLR